MVRLLDSSMGQIDRPGSRIAFFGGSFDPPHLGHLAVARAALAALRLDRVLFAPVGAQPLKPSGTSAPYADRLAMLDLAIAGEPAFDLSDADAPRPGGAPNYTLETLLKLRATLPAQSQLYCLMGADSFLSLRHWHRAAEIPFAAQLIVASRPGQPLDRLQESLPAGVCLAEATKDTEENPQRLIFELRNAAGASTPLFVLPGVHHDVSASQIRDQIRNSQTASESLWLPLQPALADYIRSRNLYASLAPTPLSSYD